MNLEMFYLALVCSQTTILFFYELDYCIPLHHVLCRGALTVTRRLALGFSAALRRVSSFPVLGK